MDNKLSDLKKKLGGKWQTFEKLHKIIVSANPDIGYRIFPIYAGYYLEDDNVAIVYFRGKFTSDTELNAGFNFKKEPKNSGFTSAAYMKYPRINYSIKLDTDKDIAKELMGAIKSLMRESILKN